MNEYLQSSEIIDFNHPSIQVLAKRLFTPNNEHKTVQDCFEWVRDQVQHSGDCQAVVTTLKASEVLEHKTGWCYAKSHLLAAILRANAIPTALCYQRLKCHEYAETYCLHGLNAVYLKEFGWYRIDARGNKEGVNAQFTPPVEQLAFTLDTAQNETEVEGLFVHPLKTVVEALQKHTCYEEIIDNFPDI